MRRHRTLVSSEQACGICDRAKYELLTRHVDEDGYSSYSDALICPRCDRLTLETADA